MAVSDMLLLRRRYISAGVSKWSCVVHSRRVQSRHNAYRRSKWLPHNLDRIGARLFKQEIDVWDRCTTLIRRSDTLLRTIPWRQHSWAPGRFFGIDNRLAKVTCSATGGKIEVNSFVDVAKFMFEYVTNRVCPCRVWMGRHEIWAAFDLLECWMGGKSSDVQSALYTSTRFKPIKSRSLALVHTR